MRTLLATTLVTILSIAPNAFAQWHGPAAPDSLSFQGRLTDTGGDPVTDGNYAITFAMYKGSSKIWEQAHATIPVSDGVFNVILSGTVTWPLDTVAFNEPIDLGIKVGANAEMVPRAPLTSAAYALGVRGMSAVKAEDPSGNRSMNLIHGATNNTISVGVVGGTIGGGGGEVSLTPQAHTVTNDFGTVSGGYMNSAGALAATVGGGGQNTASGSFSTIAGGSGNIASGNRSTIGGGLTNLASGQRSTIPGGNENEATRGYSFAAGFKAHANHAGTFVWADSASSIGVAFPSTAANQFLVRAAGGVGLGTNAPTNQLHVAESIDATAFAENHVALIDNTSTGSSADVLALRVARTDNPEDTNAFITFIHNTNSGVGAISGNGSGGIQISGLGADYAELLAHVDSNEILEPGNVVGVVRGRVSRKTAGADQIMVVSTSPMIVGSHHAPIDGTVSGFSQIAFMGQAPVDVRGSARSGDFLIPSGLDDGTAVSVNPADVRSEDLELVFATAWEDKDESGVGKVNAAIGIDQTAALVRVIDALGQRDKRREDELASMNERLAALEAQIIP